MVWRPAPVLPAAQALIAAGYAADIAAMLARRDVTTPEEARAFLEPTAADLHDPFLLADMGAAVVRLAAAITSHETVAVVGDYDVDGVTAAALLGAVFRAHGLSVLTILPHRMREGYGFKKEHVDRARAAGAGLIVTVDCGTTSGAAVQHALDQGIEVIVTDHHVPGPEFPAQAIQINPQRPDCDYPFPLLAGVGLALKLSQALCAHTGREVPLAPMLRMACLGTVADVVPLVGENRVITALGLRALDQTKSFGLRALYEVAGVRPPLKSADIGFRIGPRINAAGRLGTAEAALELLVSRDADQAKRLAQTLEEQNRQRQSEEQLALEEARRMIEERIAQAGSKPGILVAWSERWHRGVVGIAAGRLAREFHRPAVLLAVDGASATGSGRSIPDASLFDFLVQWRECYQRFGGHEAAVGMTVATDELDALRELWEKEAEWPARVLERRYEYEFELLPGEVTPEQVGELSVLEPHGAENRRPLVRVGPMQVVLGPLLFGKQKQHVRAQVTDRDGGRLWLLGFHWAQRSAELAGDAIEALGYVGWDDYRGCPQLELVDVRPAEVG